MATTDEFVADDKTFYCKRKVAYPIKSMADRVAAEYTKEDGFLVSTYKCPYEDHWHIGHEPTSETKGKRMEYKFFTQESGVLLAKIKIQDTHWVFMLPQGAPENEYSVLENGILVATKEGTGFFKEKDGVHSRHWQVMSHIMPMYPKDTVRIREGIDKHLDAMEPYDKAMMIILNRTLSEKEEHHPKRIIVRPEKALIDGQEMYQNRAVFRTPDNKPFYRDIVHCSNEDCKDEIELRAYISQNDQGQLTFVNKRVPLDGKAMIKPGPGSRTYPKWICKKCVQKLPYDKEGFKKELTTELQITSTIKSTVLTDLRRVAADNTIDPNFVRGATLMACDILSA
jgi:hypothetical protein